MDKFIKSILIKGIQDSLVENLLQNHFDKFLAAFTSKNFDSIKNYEFFEQLGDLSINKFIVSYMSKRFPQIRNSDGTGVLATLRIKYGSKDILSELSMKYQFDKFIRCTKEERIDKNKFKNILEDVFEAFFGAVEFSLDEIKTGLGYFGVYQILESIFNEIEDITIDYETLVDAKTRLNELKDEIVKLPEYKDMTLKYNHVKLNNAEYSVKLILRSNLSCINEVIGESVSNFKKIAEISSAEKGLKWIERNLKIKKNIPDRFKTFSSFTW